MWSISCKASQPTLTPCAMFTAKNNSQLPTTAQGLTRTPDKFNPFKQCLKTIQILADSLWLKNATIHTNLSPCCARFRAGAFTVAPVSASNEPRGHGLRQQSLRCYSSPALSAGKSAAVPASRQTVLGHSSERQFRPILLDGARGRQIAGCQPLL